MEDIEKQIQEVEVFEPAPKREFRFNPIKLLKSLTLCTKITVARLALAPFILLFYIMAMESDGGATFAGADFFHYYGRLIAFILFAGATSMGLMHLWIVRKYTPATPTDKFLDSVCCRLLALIGFVLVIADPRLMADLENFLPRAAAVLVATIAISRDLVVAILRHLAALRGITLDYDRVGLWKTIFQFVAIGMFMLFAADSALQGAILGVTAFFDVFRYTTWFFMAVATVLTIASATVYIHRYIKEVKPTDKT